MEISRRPSLPAVAALVLALPLAFALTASGHRGRGGGEDVFRTALVASRQSDATINGVKAGNVDWQLRSGTVRLRREEDDDDDRRVSGRSKEEGLELRVRIKRLVLRGDNDPGSVTRVAASLFCGASKAATTDPVRLSDKGDARIREDLDVDRCAAPSVVIHPGAPQIDTGIFIAVGGFAG